MRTQMLTILVIPLLARWPISFAIAALTALPLAAAPRTRWSPTVARIFPLTALACHAAPKLGIRTALASEPPSLIERRSAPIARHEIRTSLSAPGWNDQIAPALLGSAR